MAARKSRLGRGLDSLVSSDAPIPTPAVSPFSAADTPAKLGSVRFIPLGRI